MLKRRQTSVVRRDWIIHLLSRLLPASVFAYSRSNFAANPLNGSRGMLRDRTMGPVRLAPLLSFAHSLNFRTSKQLERRTGRNISELLLIGANDTVPFPYLRYRVHPFSIGALNGARWRCPWHQYGSWSRPESAPQG